MRRVSSLPLPPHSIPAPLLTPPASRVALTPSHRPGLVFACPFAVTQPVLHERVQARAAGVAKAVLARGTGRTRNARLVGRDPQTVPSQLSHHGVGEPSSRGQGSNRARSFFPLKPENANDHDDQWPGPQDTQRSARSP